MNLLFVCSKNRWRSPTAERVFHARHGIVARSAGTAASARRRVGVEDLLWADLVCVMEQAHLKRLRQDFAEVLSAVRVVVLDVPDDYRFMDPELIAMLEESLQPFIDDAC